jgi:hypothetical protein
MTHLGASLISQNDDTESNLSTLRSAMTDSIQASSAPAPVATDWLGSTCLGRTCLQWSADGELTALDLALVLERLAQVDQEVTGLHQWSLSPKPCTSIS